MMLNFFQPSQMSFISGPYSYTVLSLFFMLLLIKWFFTHTTTKSLPPSPPKFPIIGNLHQLGMLLHQSLWSLAKICGPLMHLQLGAMQMVVASSAEAACEIMKTNDHIFCDRPDWRPWRFHYHQKKVSAVAYGEYWRQARSIMVLQLLSNKKVQLSYEVREEETALLIKMIRESSLCHKEVDLSNLFDTLTDDLICRVTFGRKFSDTGSGKKFKEQLTYFFELLGGFNFEDVIPQLAWVDRVRGLEAKGDRIAQEIDQFLEGVVEERLSKLGHAETITLGEYTGCFLDNLLKIHMDNTTGMSLERDVIKALILDIYTAGIDTTATVLEWVMTELLKHPCVMKKVQDEVRTILNGKKQATEDDLRKMEYLKAVMKETLRLHPPVPTLVPRVGIQDVKVMGYDIPKGTRILVNAWAIGRDPEMWDEPGEFRPDRFFNTSIDFKGQDFQFIPFGAGRRGCPGMAFAMATMENVIADLLNKFDWALPKGEKAEELDMDERPGLTVRKKVPLSALATPFSS